MGTEEASTILIVDDDEDTLRLIARRLRGRGFSVGVATGGVEALDLLGRRRFDLILCDVVMPGLDGLELRRRVLADPALRDIPFVFLTVRSAPDDQVQALATGADGYIVKPVDPCVLVHRVEAVLRRYRAYRGEREAAERLRRDLCETRRRDADHERARWREVEIASRIQQMLLLGEVPGDVEGLDAAALTIPSAMIDGDFFEFIGHGRRCVDIIVGDVMGKGVPAALVAAAAKSEFLRALARVGRDAGAAGPPSPEQVVMAAHHRLTRRLMDLDSFVTLCYARVDLESGRVDLVDCGHTKTLVVRAATGTVETPSGGSVPLGVALWETYRQLSLTVEEGDELIFYSDGVTEARAPDGRMFGVERLTELVADHPDDDPAERVERIRAAAATFAESETFPDDLTCLAAKVRKVGPTPPRFESNLELTGREATRERFDRLIRSSCEGLDIDAAAASSFAAVAARTAGRIVREAYAGQADRRIRVELGAEENRIELDLLHWGGPFTPSAGDDESTEAAPPVAIRPMVDESGGLRVRLSARLPAPATSS